MDPGGRFWLYDPSSPNQPPKLISTPADGKGLEAVINFFEDAIAWISEGSISMKIRRYHAGKTVNFIDYSGIDPEHGAGCLGGDGKDMVWVEGFGLENSAVYKHAAYYTSPYTTDPSNGESRAFRDARRSVRTAPHLRTPRGTTTTGAARSRRTCSPMRARRRPGWP